MSARRMATRAKLTPRSRRAPLGHGRPLSGRLPGARMPAAKKGTLQLRLHAPATPDHVLLAAELFRDLLSAVRPDLSEASVTMVVSNFNMTAGLRYQNRSGKTVIETISKLIREPAETINHRPKLTSVADVLSGYGPKLQDYRPEFWSRNRLIKRFDDEFMGALSLVGQERARRILRGDTVFYSPVFRVGRTSSEKAIRARITIDGIQRDIQVKKGHEGPFFDAAKKGEICAIYAEAAWFRDEHGLLELDVKRSRLASIKPWSTTTGDDLMQAVHQYPVDIDIDDVLDDVGRF